MLLKTINNNLFSAALIFFFSTIVNYYFGFIGVNPLDNFTIYNSGYLVLNGEVPFKDYWVITGPFLDLFQSLFFKIAGVNWSSYVFHASLFNFFLSYFVFFSLKKLGLKNIYCLLYGLLTASTFYPTVGTPFVDHHAAFFSIVSLLTFILAINTKKNYFWILIPVFLILGFFSKQTPTSYFGILILILSIYYFISHKDIKGLIISFTSSIITIFFVILFFYIYDVNFYSFYEQYIKFPSSVGQERISAGGFLDPFSFSRYILKFKLIHLSYLGILILLIKNIFKNKEFFLSKDFIVMLSIILASYILIIHQQMTLNSKFIFFIIPILCGFSQIYLHKFSKDHKKLKIAENLLLVFVLISTFYNFQKYVFQRQFIIIDSFFDKKKIFTTKIIDQKSKFKWITHYSDDPEKEVKNIINAVNTIKSKQQNGEKYIVITDYQFIFSSFKLSNAVIVNKLYGYGVSYPTNKNPNYDVYKKFFLAKVNNKSVKKIYFIKPTWFNEHEFELNGIFDYKCKKVSGQNNLIVYEVQDCLK